MRAFNFSAGPAMLPEAVIQRAQQEMLDWHGTGMSVMEMSHRSADYIAITEKAESDLRDLMQIPADYEVLFLQGGASLQFPMIPMNLLRGKTTADYVVSGAWSNKAVKEARIICDVNIATDASKTKFTDIDDVNDWELSDGAAYLHYTPNETIHGLEFHAIPDVGDVPIVADMSSTILSRPVDVSQFALIYAGAQKNIGPAGLCIVIVRKDLLGDVLPGTPSMLNYKIHANNGSMYNTPATYSWYLAGLVFDWLKQQGGVEAMAEINQRKSSKLYQMIDSSDFYSNPVNPAYRSWMNIPFTLADDALDTLFLSQAKESGLLTLKGHRDLGGMRASIYNAMPEEGVDKLITFMQQFEQQHG